MPLPAALLAFESVFHAACRSAMQAAGITPAYDARDLGGDAPASRVVVEASGFARASGHMAFDAERQPFHDHYRGQLTYTITTPRTAPGVAQHDAWLAAIRALHERPRQTFARLPYKILKLEPGPGSITYVNEGERDRSELVFDVELGLPGGL